MYVCICYGVDNLIGHMLFFSQINMAVVLDYQPGRAIPQITMDIRSEVEGQPLDNYVTVKLKGVREPASFRLMCTQNTTTG